MGVYSLTEEDVIKLINSKSENKNLDFKERFNWDTATTEEKGDIVKDILAMSNTQDGGKIIFGVDDRMFNLVGLSENDYKSFDTTKLNDFLHKYTDPNFTCQVLKFFIKNQYYVVLIDIPEFQEVPILCKNNLDSSKDNSKKILQRGQIYIRTEKGSSETIKTSEEMREFLGRAVAKKGDELLRSIELLIKGKPLKSNDISVERYELEINDADDFFTNKFGDSLENHGYWRIYAFPSKYQKRRISELPNLKKLVERSVVSLRGWDYPHIESNRNDKEGSSNFGKGFQSYTNWMAHLEGFRIYQSGLFMSINHFWEDTDINTSTQGKVLSFIMIIYSVTEFFLFFKRLYEEISPDESIIIKIELHGCEDRKLVSLEPSVFFPYKYVSGEEVISIEENVLVVDIKTSYKEIASRLIKQIFYIFNWEKITDETIEHWQNRLIERKF